jgi:hypothetical protein
VSYYYHLPNPQSTRLRAKAVPPATKPNLESWKGETPLALEAFQGLVTCEDE